jgi:hypothetical protein
MVKCLADVFFLLPTSSNGTRQEFKHIRCSGGVVMMHRNQNYTRSLMNASSHVI